ncbi:MAG: hypothetical protein GEU98_09900 [Pseudonocardiaceae bacterium]|nr:hypothetical protein [Pseudonocardiaceae bacterium]
MKASDENGWLEENVTEPTDWSPAEQGPARPRHVREAEAAAGVGPEQQERWRRARAVAGGVAKAAPYLAGASWVAAAATTDWDGDGHGDVIDIGTFGDYGDYGGFGDG